MPNIFIYIIQLIILIISKFIAITCWLASTIAGIFVASSSVFFELKGVLKKFRHKKRALLLLEKFKAKNHFILLPFCGL